MHVNIMTWGRSISSPTNPSWRCIAGNVQYIFVVFSHLKINKSVKCRYKPFRVKMILSGLPIYYFVRKSCFQYFLVNYLFYSKSCYFG